MRFISLTLLLILGSMTAIAASGPDSGSQVAPSECSHTVCAYLDPSIPARDRADDLISRMTLDEKVSQMQNHSRAIPRLGIPEYDWWSEGLHGVARNGLATNFPQSIGLAATFDAELIEKIGAVIGLEGRAKYNDDILHGLHRRFAGLTYWSPNVNIFRDPRWGRGQETFGEDPYLSSRMGVGFVRGLQGDDPQHPLLVATPKHFAVHSGPESERHRFDALVSSHDLEDTYLPAFRATIVEGHAGSVMCAYNAVDGKPACANRQLIEEYLRKAWHFDGFVVSDCDAVADIYKTHHFSSDDVQASVEALHAGTDLDCGGTYSALVQAVKTSSVDIRQLDRAVKRLFVARIQLGMFDSSDRDKYQSLSTTAIDTPASRQLALRAARESIVLLKNDGILPLMGKARKIAVIGPTADLLEAVEGNYNGTPAAPLTPLAGLRNEFGETNVLYALGSTIGENTPIPIPSEYLRSGVGGATEGLYGEYFLPDNPTKPPALTRTDRKINFDWGRVSPGNGIPSGNFSVRWTGWLVPPAMGDYILSFRGVKRSTAFDPLTSNRISDKSGIRYRVSIDGKVVFDNMSTPTFSLHSNGRDRFALQIEYNHSSEDRFIDLEWQPPAVPLREAAVAKGREADIIVAVVGLAPTVEGEEMPVHTSEFDGGDRLDIRLPQVQEDLLKALSATGKPIVVVYTSGSSLASEIALMRASAILMAWYPGQSGGLAIAETLSGKNNPSGRLPITFYKSVNDLPPFVDYSMKNRTYRYFKGDVLYPFGFGLSYSSFHTARLRAASNHLNAGDDIEIHANVLNLGKVAGDDVVQLFLRAPQNEYTPLRALAGFQRIHLASGSSTEVTFRIDARTLSTVDESGLRRVVPGDYTFFLGSNDGWSKAADNTVTVSIDGSVALPK